MKAKFIEKFGPGVLVGSQVFENYREHQTAGVRNTHKGLPKVTMMAAFLDPRFKHIRFFTDESRLAIISDVKIEMQKLYDDTDVQPAQLGRRIRAEQSKFSRNVIMQEQVDSVNLGEQFLENCINQELLAYHNLPCLPMEEKNSDDTIVYTNPWIGGKDTLIYDSSEKNTLRSCDIR